MAASDGIVFEDPAIAFIDTLPVELLQNILIFLPTPSLFAAWKVNRRFAAALDGLNWRFMCLSRFRYWDERHAFDARPDRNVLGLDWKRTFLERDRASREASDLLDGIISCQTKRIEKFESFLKIGYDAKDTVLEHLAVDEDSGDGLARRCSISSSLLRVVIYVEQISQRCYSGMLATRNGHPEMVETQERRERVP